MRRLLIIFTCALIALAGCSQGEEVGSDKLKKFDEQDEPGRIGGIERESPSPSPPPPAPSPSPTQAAAAPPPKPAGPLGLCGRTQAAECKVSITADGYNPFNFRIAIGTVVRVVNEDGQARTFTADQGHFDSGSIAPGATWSYTAGTAGTFNFHDETRPFVVGSMEVV
ncbi:MAG TPA: hypothetical protein VND22_02085 [Actinomycetota bacterium]|nr:hypothetical protein [Actinomycetota bacterium]